MTWSHLVIIADVDEASARARLVERVLEERCSARALLEVPQASGGPELAPKAAALTRLRKVARTLADEGKSWLGPHAAKAEPAPTELLERMLNVQRAIHATSARHVRMLERALDRRSKQIFAARGDKR